MKPTAPPPFERYVPELAVPYCQSLWRQYPFKFTVTRPRRTRLGTHLFHPTNGHEVTVNANLKPEAFLITYLHEVAHVLTVHFARQKGPKHRPQPHGPEWKQNFRLLLEPVLTETIFPLPVLTALKAYAQNPTASTSGYPPLLSALQALDTSNQELITVQELAEGELFELGNRRFVRGPLRRTRALCTEPKSGKRYTIPAHAQVRRVG